MKILLSCMGYDSGKSGISSYMKNVAGLLKDCGHDIVALVEDDAKADFKDFEQISVPKRFSKSAAGFLFHLLVVPFKARSKNFDCILVLAGNRRFLAYGRMPTIAVVHDLSQYRVEGKYDVLRMFYLKRFQPYFGRRFTKIAAISVSTKEDIEKYWKVAPQQVELNYNGLNKLDVPDPKIVKKLGLGRYIYYVSRIEYPAKNHIGLIEAFDALPDSVRNGCKLVFTGSDWSGAGTVREYARKSPHAADIIFTGFVTKSEMSALFANASVFVFPSFSEGFGLPLLEAMSAGTPCACSKTSALGEIAGDAALTFDPNSTSEIASALEKILSDKSVAAELMEKGRVRCKDFDWHKHVEKLLSICTKAYEQFTLLDLFGLKFVNRRMTETVDMLCADLREGQRKSVAFINTHYLNTAYENPEQMERLKRFDYVLPDGSGVSLACKIMRYPYRDNLNGTDLLPRLCAISENHAYKMYFFGGKEGVAQRAVDNLKKKYPKMKVAGLRSGYFSENQESEIIDGINASGADMLFVGFGAPLQEKWVLANRDRLKPTLVFAIGGVVDVYSGDLSRNTFLRKLGLEWFGRLIQDPIRLFPRYVIGNPLFVLRVIKYKLAKLRAK